VDKLIGPLILIFLVVVAVYFMWPIWALILVCALLAAPLFWGVRWIARLSARFIKELYPKVDQDRLEFFIAVGISGLLYPATAFFLILSL
jgi:hypothetical protein